MIRNTAFDAGIRQIPVGWDGADIATNFTKNALSEINRRGAEAAGYRGATYTDIRMPDDYIHPRIQRPEAGVLVSRPRPTNMHGGFVNTGVIGDALDMVTSEDATKAMAKGASGANTISGAAQVIESAAKGDALGTASGAAQTSAGLVGDKLAAAGKTAGALKANVVGGAIAAGVEGYRAYEETGDAGEAAKAAAKSGGQTAVIAGGMAVAPTVVGGVTTYVAGASAGAAAAAGTTTAVLITATAMSVGAAAVAGGAVGYMAGDAAASEISDQQDAVAEVSNDLRPQFGTKAELVGYKNLNDVGNDLRVKRGDTAEMLDTKLSPQELRQHIAEQRKEAEKLDRGGLGNWLNNRFIGGDDVSERGQALIRLNSAEKELKMYEKAYNKEQEELRGGQPDQLAGMDNAKSKVQEVNINNLPPVVENGKTTPDMPNVGGEQASRGRG